MQVLTNVLFGLLAVIFRFHSLYLLHDLTPAFTRVSCVRCITLAVPAQADTVNVAKSARELTDMDSKGAVAEIRWQSHSSDGFDRAAAVVHLARGPVLCHVNILLGAQADDSITVECNGYVPVPQTLSTVDGSTSRVLIFLKAGKGRWCDDEPYVLLMNVIECCRRKAVAWSSQRNALAHDNIEIAYIKGSYVGGVVSP